MLKALKLFNLRSVVVATTFAVLSVSATAKSSKIENHCEAITDTLMQIRLEMLKSPTFIYHIRETVIEEYNDPERSKMLDNYYEIDKRKHQPDVKIRKYLYQRCLLDFSE